MIGITVLPAGLQQYRSVMSHNCLYTRCSMLCSKPRQAGCCLWWLLVQLGGRTGVTIGAGKYLVHPTAFHPQAQVLNQTKLNVQAPLWLNIFWKCCCSSSWNPVGFTSSHVKPQTDCPCLTKEHCKYQCNAQLRSTSWQARLQHTW